MEHPEGAWTLLSAEEEPKYIFKKNLKKKLSAEEEMFGFGTELYMGTITFFAINTELILYECSVKV